MPQQVSTAPLFQAKWPKSLDPARQSTPLKIATYCKNFFYHLLFPITYTWSHLQNCVYALITPGTRNPDRIPYSFNPSFLKTPRWILANIQYFIWDPIWNPNSHKINLTFREPWLLEKFSGTKIQIKTPDNKLIDGAFFEKERTDKVILFNGGNATQWETSEGYLNYLKTCNASVLLFNPRGVGKSSAKRSPKGWALDAYTAYEYLIQEKGYDPNNILAIGHSMGGALTTLGAGLIQKKYPEKQISAINLCSFSDLRVEINTLCHNLFSYIQEPYREFQISKDVSLCSCSGLKQIGIWFLAKGISLSITALDYIVSGLTYLLNIEMPITPSWQLLKGKKVVVCKKDDFVIPYSASMAKALEKDPKTTIIYDTNDKSNHNNLESIDLPKIFSSLS